MLGAGWTAAQTAIVVVALLAIGGGVVSVSITYHLNQRHARRERQAKVFADALAVVEEYVELPYRVRRRRDDPSARHDLADEISRIQSRLAYHQALLQIEAPVVARHYVALARAAKIQAGGQMRDAWLHPLLTADEQMSLPIRYPRDQVDAVRGDCITAMRAVLRGAHVRNAPPLPTANSDSAPA